MSYPVGRCHVHRLCLAVFSFAIAVQQGMTFPLLDAVTRLAWLPWALTSVGALLALSWAWFHWATIPSGWLTWAPPDAELETESGVWSLAHAQSGVSGWWWSVADGADAVPLDAVTVPMGGGAWLLLRVHGRDPRAPTRWLFVERRTVPTRWISLRRALRAHGH